MFHVPAQPQKAPPKVAWLRKTGVLSHTPEGRAAAAQQLTELGASQEDFVWHGRCSS